MKGTEKQVIWATEIKERVSSILRDGIVEQKKTHPENIGNIKGFESMLNIVAGFDGYAGEMIDIFSDIRRTGDICRDVYNVVMTSRATRISPIQSGELGKQLRALFEIKYEEEQE